MGLLAPLFLLGALLTAIPLLLHLTRKRRPPIPFPSFLFLRALGATARRKRRRFRDLPLLLLRMAALALLAFAFAEPVLRREAGAAGPGDRRDLALLLDRSLSMAVPGRAEAAASAAAAEIEALSPGDRAVVIAFADRAEALTELTDDREALAAAAASVAPGDAGTRFPAAFGLAGRVLPPVPGRRREAVLISDLQRNGFPEGRPEPALPPGIGLRVRRIGEPAANLYAAGVSLRPEGAGRLVANAEARLSGSPGEAAGNPAPGPAPIAELLLGGRSTGAMTAAAPFAAGVLRAESRPFSRPAEPLEGIVRLEAGPEDALAADNEFRFVAQPGSAIRILDLAGGGDSIHVREAFAVGTAPAFVLESGPARGGAALAEALRSDENGLPTVTLVRGLGSLDPAAGRALAAFVRRGGSLLAAMGPRRMGSALRAEMAGVLPAQPGETVDRLPPTRLADFSTAHPVLEPFAGGRFASLGRASFYRYRHLDDLAENAEVLARFGDGRPALVAGSPPAAEAGTAPGRVVLFASSFDTAWNDLPRRPAFVVLLHRLSEFAADYRPTPTAWRVGETVDPAPAFRLPGTPGTGEGESDREQELLVETPSGERRVLVGTAALRLTEAGFYRARRPGETEFRRLAANPPLAESDLAALDAEEVELGSVPPVAAAGTGPPASGETAAEPGAGRPLWWPLFAALLLLLLAETGLAAGGSPKGSRKAAGAVPSGRASLYSPDPAG